MSADKLAEKLNATEASIDLPEEQWRDIESAIGIKEPNKSFRCRVEHHVKLAFAVCGAPSFGKVGGPQIATVRKHLTKIGKDAKRLRDTLSELGALADLGDKSADWAVFTSTLLWGAQLHRDYPELWNAVVTEGRFPKVPNEWRDDEHSRALLGAQPFALSVLTNFAAAAELAEQSLSPSKGGAPKDIEFDTLVRTLAILYRDETGKKAAVTWDNYKERYGGEFLNFLLACCRSFARNHADKSNLAFGKAVQRALGLPSSD
jgi:hypothetical protein